MAAPVALAAVAQHNKTPFYATENWIRAQRVTGLVLMALSAFASTIPTALPAVGPLFVGGSILIGASLIQQVIGKSPGCETSRTSRAIAGACIMLIPFFGWIPGLLFWPIPNN